MIISRRGLLLGALAASTGPAIVRAASLMPLQRRQPVHVFDIIRTVALIPGDSLRVGLTGCDPSVPAAVRSFGVLTLDAASAMRVAHVLVDPHLQEAWALGDDRRRLQRLHVLGKGVV